ncbi:lamin tail domain-containing protein [Alistipes sp. OttesenSCG-928-B03]|nr:lamin tail domain-containing protein [Alistipes sp. OttesenSCG-928-B03]
MKKIFLFALALTFGFTACVEDEPFAGITSVSHSPEEVTPDNDVTVTAKTTGVSEATLKYQVGDGAQVSVAMTGSNGTFTGIIPKQADEAKVTYYVEVDGSNGIVASAKQSYTVGAVPLPLALNEVDGTNKCIELFNLSNAAISLEGVTLTKDDDATAWWTGAAGKTIPANGYYVIAQTGATVEGANEATGASGISMKKDVKFELKDANGNSLGVLARAGSTDNLEPNSFQRIPNGTGEWKYAAPTTKAVNAATGTDVPGLVK